MNGSDLPSSGPARQIFLVALARMSEQCQPPDLIAECPFSIDLPDGGRGCGAECEELLAEHEPAQRPGEIPLVGMELTARPRPRPRPAKTSPQLTRAFDATETYYRESEKGSPASWSPTSLLVGVRRVVVTHPFDRTVEQEREAEACLAELSKRGFDTEAIIRGPLAEEVAQAIVSDVATRTLMAEVPGSAADRADSRVRMRDRLYDKAVADGQELPTVRVHVPKTLDDDARNRIVFTVVGDFARHVGRWAGRASIEDLLSWDLDANTRRVDADAEAGRARDADWIFDRFTRTYLTEWNPSSLRQEWLFRRGQRSIPVPAEQMVLRRIDPVELAGHVADLAAGQDERMVRDNHLTSHAVAMLKAGHRDAAVALFDAVRQSDWDDALLHNNYGFCLLPDSPQDALTALDRAHEGGFSTAVNRANRALCLYRLERLNAGLEVIESALAEWDDLDTGESYLWAFDGETSSPELISECPRCYLVRLGAHIASATEDPALLAKWERRLSKLEHRPG